MDDFRVGPISPYDPDRRPDYPGAPKRRRQKLAEDQEFAADVFIAASEPSQSQAEAGAEPVPDYYQPSGPSKEPES